MTDYPQFGAKTAGVMIYAEPKQETKKKRKGGKGGPKVTEYKYSQTAAVEICEGPVFFRQIYFNEKLIFDSESKGKGTIDTIATSPDYITCKIKKGGLMRMYFGTETQPIDPVLQAKFGAGETSAHRGMAYILIEKLPLEDWGNQFPNVRAVVEHRTIKTTTAICAALSRQSGLVDEEFDYSTISQAVRGLQIRENQGAKQTMEGLAVAFNFFFTEEEGKVLARPFGGNVYTIPSHDLGCTERDDEIADKVESTRNDPRDVPYRSRLAYVDPEKEMEANEVHDLYPLSIGNGTAETNLPITLTFQEAQQVCSRVLYRELYDKPDIIRLSWEYLFLKVGDELILPGDQQKKRIIKIQGTGPGILTIHLLPAFSGTDSPIVQPGPSAATPGSPRPEPPTPSEPAASTAVLVQLPQLDDNDPNQIGVYVGLAPNTVENDWIGGIVQINRGNGWDTLASSSDDAILGTTVNALPDFVGDYDDTSTLTVDILPGNQLESASPTMIANGVNNAVVGGEVIQFETATQVSGYPNRWELTGIFRGLRRTELRKTEHAVGEPFMILDDSVQFTAMRQFDVDVARLIRVVTYEQDPTLALETTLTIRSGPKRPTAGATAETTATIRWVAVSAPDSQTLKYRELGTDTWTEIALSGGATDHDLTDLTAGETYETEIEAAIEGQIWTTTRISWPQWREIPAPDLSGLRASDLLTRFEDVAEDGEIMFDENGDVIIEEVPNE